MSLLNELKRRNVLRVGAAYIVTSWLIVQVAETLFPVYGLTDAAVRVVVNVLAIGLVPVLVLAWVFEWTPEGVKRDSQVDAESTTTSASAKRLDRIILAVLALALAYFAFDKFVLDPARDVKMAESARQEGRTEALIESYGDASIAVLPFENMSSDPDQEYFADGIAEEILNLLANIPELRVISRSSAFSYKGSNTPIGTIADQLGVAHILEGSVRKTGNRIRVTAQLIDARSDTHLWSQTFDRTLTDIFAIQDELAAVTVERLQLTLLGPLPHAMEADPEAYDLYLRAKHLLNLGSAAEAAELLIEAVEIDPDFVPAWADLTTAYVFSAPTMGRADHTGDEVLPKLISASGRLAELDPDHPLILVYGGWRTIEETGNYRAGAGMFSTAVRNNPNNEEVLRSASYLAMLFGEKDLSVQIATRMAAVSPLCARCQHHLYRVFMSAGRYMEASDAIDKFVELRPTRPIPHEVGVAKLMKGDTEGARFVFENHPQPDVREWGLLLIAAHAGSEQVAREELEKLEQAAANIPASWMAELNAVAGNPDEAFEMLDSMAGKVANWRLGSLLRSPLLSSLHEDPRWSEMLAIAGLSPDQLHDISFQPKLKWQ